MASNRLLEVSYEREREMLTKLYTLFPLNVEQRDVNVDELAVTLGLPSISNAGRAARIFEDLGILTRRLEYGGGNGLSFGRHYHWTLLKPLDEARALHEKNIAERAAQTEANRAKGNAEGGKARAGSRKIEGKFVKPGEVESSTPSWLRPPGEPTPVVEKATDVVVATNEAEEVKAIAGPEADSTLRATVSEALKGARDPDHSEALVEAVRQYVGRTQKVRVKVAELERAAAELGITVDPGKVFAAMDFEVDPRMEELKLMLPYIATLEQRVARQGETIADQRERLKGFDQLKREVETLRAQNQRLIGARVEKAQTAAQA